MQNQLVTAFVIMSLAGGFTCFVAIVWSALDKVVKFFQFKNVPLTREEEKELMDAYFHDYKLHVVANNITNRRGLSWRQFNFNKLTKKLKIR